MAHCSAPASATAEAAAASAPKRRSLMKVSARHLRAQLPAFTCAAPLAFLLLLTVALCPLISIPRAAPAAAAATIASSSSALSTRSLSFAAEVNASKAAGAAAGGAAAAGRRVLKQQLGWMIGHNFGSGLSSRPLEFDAAVCIMKQQGAQAVKIFWPDPAVYSALKGSGLRVMTAVTGDLVGLLAANQAEAQKWVDTFVVPHLPALDIHGIAVANELLGPNGGPVVGAMWAVYKALEARGLHTNIKVVTPQAFNFLHNTSPPSAAEVTPSFVQPMRDLLAFLTYTGSDLLVNVYPFFPYNTESQYINRDFAFFKGNNGYTDKGYYYQNLFDAMVDSVIWAVGKLGYPNVPLVIGEVGWPTGGSPFATVPAAAEWNSALVAKIKSGRGTPLRPNVPIQAYLFEAFDEDRKDTSIGPFELYWGIRYMDGSPKYPLNLGDVSSTSNPTPSPTPISNPTPSLAPTFDNMCTGSEVGPVQVALDWACSAGNADCAPIQSYGRCFQPDTLFAHAYFAFNNYYRKNLAQGPSACVFGGAARLVSKRPSKGPKSACMPKAKDGKWCVVAC